MDPTDRIFLDSNVLVYVFVNDSRSAIAERLIAEPYEISVQILNEFVSVALRKLRMSWHEIDEALSRFDAAASVVHEITRERQREGVRIARRYKLGIHDATIVATASMAGCTTLLSEDMHNGFVIDKCLTIINPFA